MPNVDQKKIIKHVIMPFLYIYGSDLRDIFHIHFFYVF